MIGGTKEMDKGCEIKKKAKNIKWIILISIALTIIVTVGVGFARYITRINGSASMDIAKWSFNSRILNSTQTQEVENFAVTRTDNNSDVVSTTIAPRNKWTVYN